MKVEINSRVYQCHSRGNQQWTINEGQSTMDNQQGAINKGQSTMDNQQGAINNEQSTMDNQQGAINNGQSRETGNVWYSTQDTRRRQSKQKQQHDMCWTPLCANKHK